MTVPMRLVGVLTITAGVVTAGCVADEPTDELSLESDLQFRDDLTGPPRGNTNFLGASDDYPLDNLPLQPGGEEDVQVVEIRGNKCRDATGALINGAVSTLPVSPNVNVTVSSGGVLGPITVALVTNPAIQCSIDGNDWEGTHWEILAQYGEVPNQETVETDLKLVDVSLDPFGSTAYLWHVNDDRVLDEEPGATYVPTCDEDPDPAAPGLEYHAYLIPDLHVAEITGAFSYAAPGNTVFAACGAGAVGKSLGRFGWSPWDLDAQTHWAGTNVVRAAYYANGVSYTTEGTLIWPQDVFGIWPDAPPIALYELEAGWSVATGAAICLSQPRRPEMTPGVGHTLPKCTAQLLANADFTTYVPIQ